MDESHESELPENTSALTQRFLDGCRRTTVEAAVSVPTFVALALAQRAVYQALGLPEIPLPITSIFAGSSSILIKDQLMRIPVLQKLAGIK